MENMEILTKLKKETNCSIATCKKYYENNNYNYEITKQELLKLCRHDKIRLAKEQIKELEQYKLTANKRANKQNRVKVDMFYTIVAWILLLLLLFSIVYVFIDSSGWFTVPISLILFILCCYLATHKGIKGRPERTYGDNLIHCPHCGCTEIHFHKKGFSVAKALVGATFIGMWGVLCGTLGEHKILGTCLKCGKQFKIDKK